MTKTMLPTETPFSRDRLQSARRLVVKVGTRTVTDPQGGLDLLFLDRLANQIARLQGRDCEVIVVTSGAVHLGRAVLPPARAKETLNYRQAAAAIGQPELMRSYAEALRAHGLVAAQMLLTMDDMTDRQRYIHVRNSMELLLRHHVVPVVNENDSVSVEGVTFVENDKLAAIVATKLRADLLVFLSDQPGLCTADPRTDPEARLIACVRPGQDPGVVAEEAAGQESRGGMRAKLAAARTAADFGIPVVMVDGREENILLRVCDGEDIGTLFVPGQVLEARKVWMATAAEPVGVVRVDAGAARALRKPGGASLLPRGVLGTDGDYGAGDLVTVLDPEGREVARGLVNYPVAEVRLICGAHSSEVPAILGHVGHEEVIHLNNLVLTGE